MSPNGGHTSVPPPPEVVRCSYVVPNKGRRCRFPVIAGTERCGAHREDDDAGPRVPCPLDPNHTVFQNRLKQHLKICTKARDRSVVEKQPFYTPGINLPSLVSKDAPVATPVSAADNEVVQSWMERISIAWPKAVKQVMGDAISAEDLLQKSVVLEGTQLAHAEKHDVQNQALADLILQELRVKAFQMSQVVLVEYGSGKGGLANAVLRQLSGLRCVLVEREPRRHKFENKQDKREEQVLRLRVDIADFDLRQFLSSPLDHKSLPSAAELSGGALSISSSAEGFLGPAERLEELWRVAAAFQAATLWPPQRLVACAKHLCGGATDIALRSLKAASSTDGKSSAFTICVATCCHHRCDANSYVNRPFLEQLNLCHSEEDFAQFASTAGWAVGGAGARDLEKRKVGMMAKRILDLGRVQWLRQELQLEDAALMDYISKAVTPENIVIVAGAAKESAACSAQGLPIGALKCFAWCCRC